MLGTTTRDSHSPHFERRKSEVRAHQRDHRRFTEPELTFNRLKGRTIFPRHLDDS